MAKGRSGSDHVRSQYGHAQLTVRSRSAHSTVTFSSRYGHGMVTVRLRSAYGRSQYSHVQLTVRSRPAHIAITDISRPVTSFISCMYVHLRRFSTCPDRPWGPPTLPYNEYRVFPGGKVRPGRAADHSPLLVPLSWKGRSITLPTLWATTGPVTGTLYLYVHLLVPTVSLTSCI